MNRLLLIIDPQIDFINGSLPISGAEEAMNNLADYISRNSGKYALKIVTADRHPFFHCSFTDCGGEWPRHCVHDSTGAAIWQPLFRPLYETEGAVSFLYKGESEDRDEYSIFKNPEATRTAIGPEEWLHTGDLGIIDKNGYLFIKGRSKNMILGPTGQNIYPEEIEDRLNSLPYVSESLVIEHNGKLLALVYPDYEQTKKDKISAEQLKKIMSDNRKLANTMLPAYSQIARLKIRETEFEKTPKRSIKRYLYQE